MVRELEKDIRMWQESSQHDDKDKVTLKRQLQEVLEEAEVERQAIMKQNDELLQENIYLSERCESLKTEYTRQGNLLDVQDDLTRTGQELTHYKRNNLQRAQEVLRVQTVRVTRFGRCYHLEQCQGIRDCESRALEMCTFCASDLSERHRVMLSNR